MMPPKHELLLLIFTSLLTARASQVALVVKNLPGMQET